MVTQYDVNAAFQRKYFIEDRSQASYFSWLFSKGTNYTCYLEYLNGVNHEQELNDHINIIRTIVYAFSKPIQFTFFYWTLLIFLLHKFNFRKPIMKLLLAHFILRSTGDILDQIGGLMGHYFSNDPIVDANGAVTGYKCRYDAPSTEMHPLKWVLTRQIATVFWFSGEIFADWYPLLRTIAVVKDIRLNWSVYASCGLFNLSKISLILYQFSLSPKELYDNNGVYNKDRVSKFYNVYWIIQLIIIYASVIYDFAVFFVLKKNVFKVNKSEFGFMKKFRNISEFRILVAAFISFIFLPIVSFTIIMKFFYIIKYKYYNLEFSFDAIRQLIANGQHFMIFIDQILLMKSNEDSNVETTAKISNNGYGFSGNFSMNTRSTLVNSPLSPMNENKTFFNLTDNNTLSSSNTIIYNDTISKVKRNNSDFNKASFPLFSNYQNILLEKNMLSNDDYLGYKTNLNSSNNLNYGKLRSPSIKFKDNTYISLNRKSNNNLNSNYYFNNIDNINNNNNNNNDSSNNNNNNINNNNNNISNIICDIIEENNEDDENNNNTNPNSYSNYNKWYYN